MQTFKVTVSTPGHKLVHRSKVVRTPVTFHKVTEKEAKILELQARTSSLKCDIEDEFETIKPINNIEDAFEDIKIDEKKETIVEPTTILDSLLSEN